MKKIFTLFAALAMVMSMFAANIPAGTKLYLTPNSNWKQSNARFAAYFFGNGEAWVSMTKVAGETDLYELTSPNKSYTNVIFCRMNPSASANNWNNKWNQTGDLTYDGNNNHYKINAGSWDKGTWSKYVTTVTVTIQAENGTVTGLTAGGTYDSGSTATLTAVPNDGYEFVNWTVGGKEVSTANPYTFTVNDNITLVANFKEAAAKAYTITTSATNGTVEGAATVVEGESVTLTATANPGYKFVNWTIGGVEVSTDNPYTFAPTEDATVVANFEQLPPETVYFVNVADWTGTINIHAWGGTASGTAWPGNPATKEDYQIGGHDVYSLTAAAGAYANVIFNNKIAGKDGGSQTDDLEWTAGKYYVVNEWLTKEEAEEKLASGDPLGLTYNVTVPEGTNACYIAGDMNGWSQQEMTKVDDTHYTITIVGATTANKYKYCSGPDWKYTEVTTDGGDVQDRTYSENDVVAKWKEVYTPDTTPEEPAVITYVLMGVNDDWTTGITMTVNPDNANEYMLLNQPIAEGDSVKVVTLTNGVKTAYCGNVKEGVTVTITPDDKDGNIILAPGNYDFYYDVTADNIWIAAVSETPDTPDTPDTPATYYVTGNEALLGAAAAWNPAAIAMTEVEGVYTHTFTAVTAGVECQLKVTKGDWVNGVWGYDNLSNTPDGVTTDGDRNIVFTLAEDGDVLVTFDGEKITVEGNFAVSEPEPQVITYVLMGVGGDWKTGIALTKNEQAEGEEYQLLGQTISEGDAVKVVTLNNGTATAWCGNVDEYSVAHSADDKGNIVLAPGKYDFYFKLNDPTTADDDIIYIGLSTTTALDNVNTTVAPVKAIVNGQLVIIRDGVKYNVQGAVIK